MNKEEMEPQLAGVMDAVPVCEGLIFANNMGEVIIGQTLTETDHALIANRISSIFKTDLNATQKGKVKDISIGLEDGYIVAVAKDDQILIGILGSDGKTSMGLLSRQMKNIMK